MTQKRNPEGDVAEAVTESGWIQPASDAASTLAAEMANQLKVNIATYLINESFWSAGARTRMLAAY